MSSDLVFSITVPIGSYHPFLASCLASLRAQNVPLEIAVLDASKDDRVRETVDHFSDIITFRHHGPDNGQADAIMKGWASTQGGVLGWLNADDVLAPGALRSASRAFLADPSRDVIYGHSLICDDDSFITGYHWNVMPPGEQILSTCSISQPSCFFKRSALEEIGGLDRGLHYTMDWDLWIRLHQYGAKFYLEESIRSLVLWSKQAKTGGFGRTRRAEIKQILDTHADSADRWNAYLGFTTQYIYEYILPRSVRDWIWRRNVSGGRTMFGLNVSGDIEDRAFFELFHYDRSPKSMIELKTKSKGQYFRVVINGEDAMPCASDGSLLRYALPKQLPAGLTTQIELQRATKNPIHVGGIRLL